MDDRARDLLRDQDGVVSRQQVLELGIADHDIERLLRRRAWARVHPGVYVDHTGPLTWRQRAWAAVLFYAPAALAGPSALRAVGVRGHDENDDAAIWVCVDSSRSVRRRPGVRVERLTGFESRTQGLASPPRLRIDHALVAEASRRRTDDAALAVLADGVQRGHTTVPRLVSALCDSPRLRRRALLLAILEDVGSGAYSVLEQRYLCRVERPHGLPIAARQRRVRPGKHAAYRDVDYLEHATVVELDGRIGHEGATDRWADLDRDLDTALGGGLTVRVGWGQVLQPCRLAAAIARLLISRAPIPSLRGCGPNCPVADIATSSAPGAEEVAMSTGTRPARQRPRG